MRQAFYLDGWMDGLKMLGVSVRTRQMILDEDGGTGQWIHRDACRPRSLEQNVRHARVHHCGYCGGEQKQ